MLGLSPLGIVHTALSLVAVALGAFALIRDKEITCSNTLGKAYVGFTVLVCLTGFGIFRHDGHFNKAHVLGVITLVVIAIAAAAARSPLFGKAGRYIATVGYSLTFFFHLIPGITETATRLPPSAPLAASQEAAGIQQAIGFCFVVFLIGATWQVLRLRKRAPSAGSK